MKYILPFLITLTLLAGCSTPNDPTPDPGNGGDPGVTLPRLKSVTIYFQDKDGNFKLNDQTRYTYSSKGRLLQDDQYQYDAIRNSFWHFSTTTYKYVGVQLALIEKTLVDSGQKTVTHYEYDGDKISKISRHDVVDTEGVISYLPGGFTEVVYTSSNGRWFTYKFSTVNQNIDYEQTRGEDQQLASESTYEYDHHHNPYRLLGYTDMFFAYYPENNKVKNNSAYYALAFPQFIPYLYTYEYNADNYPVQMITTYKSAGNNDVRTQSKTVFEYQ